MKLKRFKEWFLNEDGTSTACVATFMRPVSDIVRSRQWPDQTDEFFKKKKKTKDK